MDKCREAFEQNECEECGANYEDMKKNWVWYESQFGYRYSPDSIRGKKWAVWQKAWQHQQAKVEELQKRVDSLTQTMEELLEEMKYPTATFEEVIVCGAGLLEQALKVQV